MTSETCPILRRKLPAFKLSKFRTNFDNKSDAIRSKFNNPEVVDQRFNKITDKLYCKMTQIKKFLSDINRQCSCLHKEYEDLFDEDREEFLNEIGEDEETFVEMLNSFNILSTDDTTDFMEDLDRQLSK